MTRPDLNASGFPAVAPLRAAAGLLSGGYGYISSTCARLQSDVFATRAGPLHVICMRGPDAAELFYNPQFFQREGAIPLRVRKPIFGADTVHVHDGEVHRWRKSLFLFLLDPEPIEALVEEFTRQWHARAVRWELQDEVVFLPEMQDVLCRAVCRWAGVPLTPEETRGGGADFTAMIESPLGVGPQYRRGMRARKRACAWLQDLIEQVRRGALQPPRGSALERVAHFRTPEGTFPDLGVITNELINILRPTVAVSRYITFAALALHDHPQYRERLAVGDPAFLEQFSHEVRRFYPFIPALAARVRAPLEWRGHRFPAGALTLLDLYGTGRDPSVWKDADAFRPERFATWDGSPFNFIPQGGSEPVHNHRCPGERITASLIAAATRLLAGSLRYDVPPQDVRVRLNRIPALPELKLVLRNLRRLPDSHLPA